MTDKELRDLAVTSLEKTTVSYPEWKKRLAAGRYNPKDGSTTEWGKAFNYLKQIGEVVDPDPDPEPSGYWWKEEFSQNPASFWNWAYGSNNNAGFPNGGASLQNGWLRLGTPPNSPGGAGILSAMWNGGSQAHGGQGEIWTKFQFKFGDTFNGWFFEHHENYPGNEVYSPAIGLDTDRRLIAQTTGGPHDPHLDGKPGGTRTKDTQVLSPGTVYTLVEHMILSPRHDTGLHEAFLNGRRFFRHQRGTLLTDGSYVDRLAFGLYAYAFTAATAQTFIEFDNLVMGPTATSVGATVSVDAPLTASDEVEVFEWSEEALNCAPVDFGQ